MRKANVMPFSAKALVRLWGGHWHGRFPQYHTGAAILPETSAMAAVGPYRSRAIALLSMVASIAAGFSASACLAASDSDEFSRIGFFGEWAEDCAAPAAADNLRYVVKAMADGSAEAYGYVDEGGGPAVVTSERFVGWRGADLIEIRTDYIRPATYAPVQAIVKIEADRLRFMAATGLDGKELIRDGRLVDDDRPTPWFYRCGGSTS